MQFIVSISVLITISKCADKITTLLKKSYREMTEVIIMYNHTQQLE